MSGAVTRRKSLVEAGRCGLAALLLVALHCSAQQFSFRETAGELRNRNVNAVVQDRSGFLWVGTENGLFRYDGAEFREFGTADARRGRGIHSLYLGLDGTLWVGTASGVFYQRKDERFAEVPPPPPLEHLATRMGTEFAALSPDRVVVADRTGGFLLRRTGPEQWAAEPMHLEGADVSGVMAGPDGALWYGCDLNLCRLTEGKTTHFAASLPAEHWRSLLKARDGSVWLRGDRRIAQIFPSENRSILRDLPSRTASMRYVGLAEDSEGRILASQGAGFGVWEGGRWRMAGEANGLPGYEVSTLFVDREDSVWVGQVGHGLRRWAGRDRWEGFTVGQGLSNDEVWATLRDRAGRMWIGTASGLDWIPPGKNQAQAWKGETVRTTRAVSLAESADGAIWMGSAAGSVTRIDPRTLAGRQWKTPGVHRILADRSGRLWVATRAGLYSFDTGKSDPQPQRVEAAAIGDSHRSFTDLAIDSANHLWATGDGGLFRLDGSRWTHIDAGIAGIHPRLIAPDLHGNLWATEELPGLLRLRIAGDRIDEVERIARPQLLSDDAVSLELDSRGWLWVGQDAGLTVFDGRNWRGITQNEGLIWNDADAYALSEDKDGSMWIGTSGGLAHLIDPQWAPPAKSASLVFSAASFGAETVASGARIDWRDGPLTFSVTAIGFRDAQPIRIRYRLLGRQPNWEETQASAVHYSTLRPGDYRFQAMAIDAAGYAISPVAEFSLHILPRWWQSRLFQAEAIALGLLALLLLFAMRQRLTAERKQRIEKEIQLKTQHLDQEKTRLLRAQERLSFLAEHDDLTGLWNHDLILERLCREVDRSFREGSSLSVILVDLDRFAQINASLGHRVGDRILREIAALLQNSLRSYDWVGRYGGEKFLLVLPSSGCADARRRAEHLRVAIEMASIQHGNAPVQVTASLGVACGFPSNYELILQAAQSALARAKGNGRNCVAAMELETCEILTAKA